LAVDVVVSVTLQVATVVLVAEQVVAVVQVLLEETVL
jgi:hypothetical protein